jgi:uncharacterized protein YdaU (DUF1376 family)
VNYYPFNVGDYAAHTAHLEPMEDLAYRRLLDQYYLREGPLPADIQATAKLVRMRSMAADVESVLREFFTLTEAGWTHKRCDLEIERMQDKQAKARASAQASVSVRQAKQQAAVERSLASAQADVERTLPVSSTDVELPTPTPTPTPTPIEEKTKTPRKRAAAAQLVSLDDLMAEGVDRQHAVDWLAVRSRKSLPLTRTAWTDTKAEAVKAGLTPPAAVAMAAAQSWGGFKASWVGRDESRRGAAPTADALFEGVN